MNIFDDSRERKIVNDFWNEITSSNSAFSNDDFLSDIKVNGKFPILNDGTQYGVDLCNDKLKFGIEVERSTAEKMEESVSYKIPTRKIRYWNELKQKVIKSYDRAAYVSRHHNEYHDYDIWYAKVIHDSPSDEVIVCRGDLIKEYIDGVVTYGTKKDGSLKALRNYTYIQIPLDEGIKSGKIKRFKRDKNDSYKEVELENIK